MDGMTVTAAAPAAPRPVLGSAATLAAQVRSSSGRTVDTFAPYSGARLATLPSCTAEDADEAFARARRAQPAWARVPVRERARIVLRFHDLLLDRQDEVLDLVQAENGKARRDALLEVADVANTARYYARRAPGLLRDRHRAGMVPVLTVTREVRHPKGVAVVISPWNYPLSLAAGDTLPALLAGNAVVQKPDTQTALTALWTLARAREAGLPADVWQMVVGPARTLGPALIRNADYLMFTGSTASGRTIAEQAGARLLGCALELGGKNPMLVLDDADLDRAVEGAVRGCFSSSGQLCISIERLYVQDGIYEPFVARFLAAIRSMKIGADLDFSCDMGSLTGPRQLETVEAHVQDARAKGARLLIGGRRRPDLGPLFYEPTVLADVPPTASCYAEETFGPVVSLYRFGSVDEAVARANDTRYGLNASVWTRDTVRGRELARRLDVGAVNVNEAYAPAWGSIDAPMGGRGESGLGRRHGADGLLKYTDQQTVALQRLHNLTAPSGVSQESFARAVTASMRILRRIGWR
jgi:succinate-semialdehyde dehydrogenase/glutarate-semialdehyde dehydrogenase